MSDSLPSSSVSEHVDHALPSLGVLFVHGIGQQEQGSSLAGWTDGIAQHLQRLLTMDDLVPRHRSKREEFFASVRNPRTDDDVARLEAMELQAAYMSAAEATMDDGSVPLTLSGTRLRSHATPDDPAHLVMTLRAPLPIRKAVLTEDNAAPAVAWLMAESWWAQDFNPPPARVMLRWALIIAPMVILSHFATLQTRLSRPDFSRLQRVARWCLGLPMYVASLCMLVLLIVVLGMLLILGLLPIPKVGAFARNVGARLAASVGDSYVLIASPTEYDAMVSRVERDLTWLSQRCDRVAVVAHSQGAVIAHRALKRHAPPNLRLFVTVGSGLSKLTEISGLRTRSPLRRSALMVEGTVLLGLGVSAFMWLTSGGGDFTRWFALGNLAVYVAMSGWIFRGLVRDREMEQTRRRRDLMPAFIGGDVQWVDFYSSADPVPNGPILEEDPEWLRSYETWYESSWVRDHVGYRSNVDGLIAPLVVELANVANDDAAAVAISGLADEVVQLGRRRAWRCVLLVRARFVLALVVLFGTMQHWDSFERLAVDIREAIPDGLKSVISTLVDVLPLPELNLDVDTVVAWILVGLASLTLFAAVTAVWRRIGRRDLSRFYRGDSPDFGGPPLVAFLILLATAGLATALPLLYEALPVKPPDFLLLYVGGIMYVDVFLAGLSVYSHFFERQIKDLPAPHPIDRERQREAQFDEALQMGGIVLVAEIPVLIASALLVAHWSDLPLVLAVVLALVAFVACVVVPGVADQALPLARRLANPVETYWTGATTRRRGLRDAGPSVEMLS